MGILANLRKAYGTSPEPIVAAASPEPQEMQGLPGMPDMQAEAASWNAVAAQQQALVNRSKPSTAPTTPLASSPLPANQAAVRASDNAIAAPTPQASQADVRYSDEEARLGQLPNTVANYQRRYGSGVGESAQKPITMDMQREMGVAPPTPTPSPALPFQANISSNYTPPEEPAQRMGLGRILANARLGMGQRLVKRNYARDTSTASIGIRG
jgi:hypothetical protein